jgi:hypothetical protein
VFDVLGHDHDEVKQMLAELEAGPTAATGADDSDLARRKKLVEQLVIEESKHEAVEEMYFWPTVRDKSPTGATWPTPPSTKSKRAKKSSTSWTRPRPANRSSSSWSPRSSRPAASTSATRKPRSGHSCARRSAPRKPATWETRSSRPKDRADPPAPPHASLPGGPEDGGTGRRGG